MTREDLETWDSARVSVNEKILLYVAGVLISIVGIVLMWIGDAPSNMWKAT